MGSTLRRFIASLFGICLLVVVPRGFSQSTPRVIALTVTNVSGMCYASVTFTNFDLTCCSDIVSMTQVGRSDTNLQVTLYEYRNPDCISFPECTPPPITRTLVLGALDPGQYSLRMLWYPTYSQSLISFNVPNATTTTSMLTLSQTNAGALSLDVAGISDAIYVVQSSIDFTNWTNVHTNNGGPFNVSLPVATNDACYYRVQVSATH